MTANRSKRKPRITPTRKPQLRAVSHSLENPRHAAVWYIGYLNVLVEVITEAEWQAMTEAERPENAILMPGIGYISTAQVDEQTKRDVNDVYQQQLAQWQLTRGIKVF